jgi:two-component system sensor histidine kinase DegS
MSKEIRGIIHSLHPAEIDKYGLIDAIELLSHHFNQDSGIDCETLFNGDARFVAKKNEVHIYRIVQEALNNISKHSRASQVAVNIIFDKDKVIGSIQDNGIGFDLNKSKAASASAEGFGIIGMSERTRILGGTLKINSIKDKGTEIVFEIPNREFIYE